MPQQIPTEIGNASESVESAAEAETPKQAAKVSKERDALGRFRLRSVCSVLFVIACCAAASLYQVFKESAGWLRLTEAASVASQTKSPSEIGELVGGDMEPAERSSVPTPGVDQTGIQAQVEAIIESTSDSPVISDVGNQPPRTPHKGDKCLSTALGVSDILERFHDDFTDEMEEKYPLTPEALSSGWKNGKLTGMVAFLEKLIRGEALYVLEIGGSFPYGDGCEDDLGRKRSECAWGGRTKRWLEKAFPRSSFVWYNKMRQSSTSIYFLTSIGAMVKALPVPPDLVLLDTLINDVFEPTRGVEHLNKRISHTEAQSAGFESLIRALQSLLPKAQILTVQDACPRCIAEQHIHTKVAAHYRIPMVNYAEMARLHNKGGVDSEGAPDLLWPQTPAIMDGPYGKQGSVWPRLKPKYVIKGRYCCTTNHPPWFVHQYLADSVSHAIMSMLQGACAEWAASGNNAISDNDATSSYWPEHVLNKFPVCLTPLMFYSANLLAAAEPSEPSKQPRVLKGDWQLTEDRKGKPGWIGTQSGSVIEFPLEFNKQGKVDTDVLMNANRLRNYERHNIRLGALTIAWLTSYEGVGDAHARLYPEENPDSASKIQILKGSVPERVSQVKVGFFRLGAKQDADHFSCGIDGQNRYVLEVTIPPGCSKFKIVEVTSC